VLKSVKKLERGRHGDLIVVVKFHLFSDGLKIYFITPFFICIFRLIQDVTHKIVMVHFN